MPPAVTSGTPRLSPIMPMPIPIGGPPIPIGGPPIPIGPPPPIMPRPPAVGSNFAVHSVPPRLAIDGRTSAMYR